ncbi:hypothetical protein EG355_15945 [Serratia marcescens]|nr:hypothetical protein EG355_15945 [Serratia marcescens]
MKAGAGYNGDFPFFPKQKALNVSSGLSALFDAWQFMAGVLPAPLRAVASQRSNPLPADLSYTIRLRMPMLGQNAR